MTTGNPAAARPVRVVVTQHRLLHYRQAFFERLRQACADRGIELRLVHGQASAFDAVRKDTGSLPWADVVRNRYLRVAGVDLIWQPFPRELRDAALIVLMQENKLLSNYPWLLGLRGQAGQRLAYWGHGRNLQSKAPTGPRECWKRWFVGRVDGWLAYTEATREILRADGYPAERIAVLDNAIDNDQFTRDLQAAGSSGIQRCHALLGTQPGMPIGLYCGSLYPDKRLDLMVEAADLVHAQMPEFRLVVIGDGPSRSLLDQAATTRPWLHCVGVQRGIEKAAWFRLASAYWSPGAVGLHVLDAFCAGIPIITTHDARHGPEVAYLKSGRNGYIVEADARAFADTFLALMRDPQQLARIRGAAAEDARRYTLQNMVERFVEGIERCLALPRMQ